MPSILLAAIWLAVLGAIVLLGARFANKAASKASAAL